MSFTHSFHPTVSHGFFESRFFLKSQSVSRRSVHLESFFTHRPKPGNSLAPRCFTILKRHWELRAGCLPIRRFGWYPPWNNIYIWHSTCKMNGWKMIVWLFPFRNPFLAGVMVVSGRVLHVQKFCMVFPSSFARRSPVVPLRKCRPRNHEIMKSRGKRKGRAVDQVRPNRPQMDHTVLEQGPLRSEAQSVMNLFRKR